MDTLADTLRIYADMISGIQVNAEAMRKAALQGFATATDLADYLVRKGIPFRDAHEIVAQSVQYAEKKACDLSDLTLSELQQFSSNITADVFSVLTLEGSLKSRNHPGGTAPEQVKKAIGNAKKELSSKS